MGLETLSRTETVDLIVQKYALNDAVTVTNLITKKLKMNKGKSVEVKKVHVDRRASDLFC